ncbi:hypothetical protein [Bartonella koehlerae]|uniref:hypothetical protein n=1 Tax=Bartonella koehlerae TaxID=92181 RepID=UPI0018A865AF|nr:hypothetical protein [Bartonella koehlerae]
MQNVFIDPVSMMKAFFPQVASYVVMPNALFYAGFSDIAKQNEVLADICYAAVHAGGALAEMESQNITFWTYGNLWATLLHPKRYGGCRRVHSTNGRSQLTEVYNITMVYMSISWNSMVC